MYKFLIIDTYYLDFLSDFYSRTNVENASYDEHLKLIMDELFGTADFYSKNLKKLGCEAGEIIFNDFNLQGKWAKEHGLKIFSSLFSHKISKLHKIFNKIPVCWKFEESYKILKAQIKCYKPEILYIQDIRYMNDRFLTEIKEEVKLIVGQIASPVPPNRNIKAYDLIFTSFPHFVKKFRDMGIKSEYLKIAFEPSVLAKIGNSNLERKYNCVFIGGLTRSHTNRIEILERLSNELEIDFFGYGIKNLSDNSPIKSKYNGKAWGINMYRVLSQSKITVNIHINVAENYANNMRLYEATGCGALLVTDYKDNLSELFKINKEVVTYKNVDELIELLKYYTIHNTERTLIAQAGQKRTLSEHTYLNRMKEILEVLPRINRK